VKIVQVVIISMAVFLFAVNNCYGSEIGFSYAATSGNTKTESIGIDLKLIHSTINQEVIFKGEIKRQESEGDVTVDLMSGYLKDIHYIPEWNSGGFVPLWYQSPSVKENYPAGIELALSYGIGAGLKYNMDNFSASASAGPEFLFEDRTDDTETSQGYVKGNADASYKAEYATFSLEGDYSYPLETEDDYRANGEASVKTKLVSKLSLRTGVKVNYVNLPPEDVENVDTYTFAAVVLDF